MPIAGTVVSDLVVRGPVMAPRVDGTLRIDNAALRIATPRLSFASVTGNVVFSSGRAVVDDVTGEANGAPFLIRGAYDLSGATPPTLSFTAVSVPVQTVADGPRAEVDVDVQYAVADGKPVITGSVSFLPQPYRGSILALRNVITQLQQVYGSAPTGGARRNARRQSTPVGLDIAVKSTDTLSLDTNVGRVELSADLHVKGTLNAPTLLGTVVLGEGGQLRAGGRTYRVQRGTVTFSNPRRVEPVLDITADTHISSYDVTMTVTGSTDALRTSLRSDPPLAESDLRSLLVTGRTASESARRGDVVDQERVVESLSSDLFGFAAQAVGLDAVSIGVPDLDLIAGGIDASTSLNIKKSLTSKVELVFSQDLQKGKLSWLATYRPLRSTSLRLVSREGTSGAVEVRQERTFGGGTKRTPASAKKSAPKPKIIAVTFRGLTGMREETLRKQLRLEVGDRFDVWKLQDDSTRLLAYYHKLGYLQAQVRSTQSTSDAGVSIEHNITRGPRSVLKIEGHDFPKDILERMDALWGEALTDEFLADDLAKLARRHLVDDGYMNARVTVTTVESTRDRLAFTMSVEPGDQVKTRAVVFSGNTAFKDADLLAVLQEGDLERSGWYDPETLEQPLATVYRRQGYLDVEIETSPVRVVGTRAELPVTVTEGRPYRIASIDVRGARARPLPEIQRIIGLTPGSQLRVDEVRAARLRLQTFYVEQGFDEADVRVQRTVDRESATVIAVFNVTEGQRRVVDDLRIVGNQETLTKIISDFANLQAGTPVTSALVSDLQKRLYDTGVFTSVAVTFEPVKTPPPAPPVSRDTGAPIPAPAATGPPDPDRVVTVVSVEEAPRYSVRYGVQMSKSLEATGTESAYAPGAGADFRDRNLFGRAIAAGVGVRGDRNSQSVQGLIGIQRTYGHAIRSNLFINGEQDHQGELGPYRLDERDASVVLEQRTRLKTPLELSWALAYENRHDKVIDRPTDLTLLVIDGVTVGPRVALTRDTRDNPFDAKHGLLDSAAVDFGIKALGSDLGYSRVLLQHFQFVSIRKIVLATGVRLGDLATVGEPTTLELDLRFKAGGSRTVRGYPEDSLGPPGILGLFGNNDLFIFNQEIRFPIWKWFKGVAFVDAGNTFPSLSDVRLDALKVGTGGGLRLATPVGLFRVDLGFPVSAGTTRTPRWYFSIGQAF